MSFPHYTPTPTKLVTLNEADDEEPRAAATTNVSLEQLADGIAWINGRIRSYVVSYDDETNALGLAPTSSYLDWGFYVDVPGVRAGDLLCVDSSFTLTFSHNGSDDQARVRVVAAAPDASTVIPAGSHIVSELRGLRAPTAISGRLLAAQNGTYRIKMQGKTKNGDPGFLELYDAAVLRVLHVKA